MAASSLLLLLLLRTYFIGNKTIAKNVYAIEISIII
jgi:hypothetical protein